MDKSIGLLLAENSSEAPLWKVENMEQQLSIAINGLASYVISSVFVADAWTNFTGKLDRPNDSLKISQYILNRMTAKICSTSFDAVVKTKNSEEAKEKTLQNINSLQRYFKKITSLYQLPFSTFTNEQFPCLNI